MTRLAALQTGQSCKLLRSLLLYTEWIKLPVPLQLKLAEPRLARGEAPLLPPPPRDAKHLAPAVSAPPVATNRASRLPPAEQDGDDTNGFSIPTADAIR